MLQPEQTRRSTFSVALTMLELIYYSIVCSVRKEHKNAFLAIATNILQAMISVMAFYAMFLVLGLRRRAAG